MEIQLDEQNIPYIQLSDKYRIALEKQPINTEFEERAKRELRELPEIVEPALRHLRALIQADPDLHVPLRDEYLYKFLRPCKFYPQSAFELLKRYYKFKLKHPNLCSGVLPSTERKSFAQGVISFQPKRDKNGSRILLLDIGRYWKPSVISLWDVFKVVQLGLESAMEEPLTQVTGVVTIIDLQDLSLTQVYHISPMFAKIAVDWVQTCMPIRLKAVHIVNQPFIFNMAFAIFKPFFSEKLRNRIFFHGKNMESICSHIGADSLRPCYGGTMDVPQCDGSLLCDLLCHYDKDFIKANTYGYTPKAK